MFPIEFAAVSDDCKTDKKTGTDIVTRYEGHIKTCEVHYTDGKRHGTCMQWNEDGELTSLFEYREGKRHGPSVQICYHDDAVEVSEYVDGDLVARRVDVRDADDPYDKYCTDICSETVHSVWIGPDVYSVHETFYLGTMSIGILKNGKNTGDHRSWRRGSLERHTVWVDGKEVKAVEFDSCLGPERVFTDHNEYVKWVCRGLTWTGLEGRAVYHNGTLSACLQLGDEHKVISWSSATDLGGQITYCEYWWWGNMFCRTTHHDGVLQRLNNWEPVVREGVQIKELHGLQMMNGTYIYMMYGDDVGLTRYNEYAEAMANVMSYFVPPVLAQIVAGYIF